MNALFFVILQNMQLLSFVDCILTVHIFFLSSVPERFMLSIQVSGLNKLVSFPALPD